MSRLIHWVIVREKRVCGKCVFCDAYYVCRLRTKHVSKSHNDYCSEGRFIKEEEEPQEDGSVRTVDIFGNYREFFQINDSTSKEIRRRDDEG